MLDRLPRGSTIVEPGHLADQVPVGNQPGEGAAVRDADRANYYYNLVWNAVGTFQNTEIAREAGFVFRETPDGDEAEKNAWHMKREHGGVVENLRIDDPLTGKTLEVRDLMYARDGDDWKLFGVHINAPGGSSITSADGSGDPSFDFGAGFFHNHTNVEGVPPATHIWFNRPGGIGEAYDDKGREHGDHAG